MEPSSRSRAVMATVTVIIWAMATGMVITTDGIEAEGIITAGGIIATDSRFS
jgi:hypothetical protein